MQQLLAVNLGALDWASFEEEIKHESPEERLLAPPWPVLDPAAYHGVLGRIARDIEPHSEADPAGILLQVLMMFGSTIGRRSFYAVEGTTHHCNLYSVLVGKTAQSRKGTSWGRAQQVFNTIQERPPIKGGLSSGEGLVDAVHDDIQKWVPGKKNSPGHFVIEKPAVADKRLYVSESEFGRVLVVMDREGNSLSQFLREAWETGALGSMTKNNPVTATDAHVSICGQITRDELFARLKEVDVYNGLYNRFLWWCVRRSKTLPRGGESDIYKITKGYDPQEYLKKNEELRAVVDWVGSNYFTPDEPPGALTMLRDNFYHSDPFLCLPDFESYSECQKKVGATFREKSRWSKMAILNTARMGKFSSDRTIKEYARDIWKVAPVHI